MTSLIQPLLRQLSSKNKLKRTNFAQTKKRHRTILDSKKIKALKNANNLTIHRWKTKCKLFILFST